jgi:hypothetical protein
LERDKSGHEDALQPTRVIDEALSSVYQHPCPLESFLMQTISQASDPITAFQQAKEAGNITITGNNVVSNLKVNAALSSMDVLKFFYGVLFGHG